MENNRSGMRLNALSCVALPTCGLALAESERVLPDLSSDRTGARGGRAREEDAISIRITGCPNGCARPYLAEIGFVGKAPNKYALYLGANYNGTRLNRLVSPSTTIDDAVKLLAPIIKRYCRGARRRGRVRRLTAIGRFCPRMRRSIASARPKPPTNGPGLR